MGYSSCGHKELNTTEHTRTHTHTHTHTHERLASFPPERKGDAIFICSFTCSFTYGSCIFQSYHSQDWLFPWI